MNRKQSMNIWSKIIVVIILSSISLTRAYAQDVPPEILDSLYIRSLRNDPGLQLSAGYKYIEPTVQTRRISDYFESGPCKFPSPDQLFKIAYRNNRHLDVYRLNYKVISKDTIDINVDKVTLHVKRGIFMAKGKFYFKKASYFVSCGGTNGYQPRFRYVYHPDEHTWTDIIGKF